MNIRELCIGDWVATPSAEGYIIDLYTSEKAGCIARLVHDDVQMVSEWECIHLEPIPLTPEILEKNGISKTYESDEYAVYKGEGFNVTEYYTELWEFERHRNRLMIRNVHQLQHALRLAGVGKEIIL